MMIIGVDLMTQYNGPVLNEEEENEGTNYLGDRRSHL